MNPETVLKHRLDREMMSQFGDAWIVVKHEAAVRERKDEIWRLYAMEKLPYWARHLLNQPGVLKCH